VKGKKMAIYSCDHGDFIVIYELKSGPSGQCPVCKMEKQIGEVETELSILERAKREEET